MKKINVSMVACHILLIALVVMIFLPGEKKTEGPESLLVAMLLMESYYIYRIIRYPEKRAAASDIMSILWGLMLAWEICVTKLDLMHPVLVPALENIFTVFRNDYLIMAVGVLSSLEILFIGVAVGLALGTFLGLFFGWNDRLRHIFGPIANVLAPIPSVVFAPYVIAIMPTFRSASVVVILLGIFWPTLLKTIISVESIDKNIVDSARTLGLKNTAMIFQVLLPYSVPSIISGLKVTMTTAVMMLTFAEMMGSTKGMGYYIVNFNTYGNYTKVIAGIIVVALVVTLLSSVIHQIQQRAIKWQKD